MQKYHAYDATQYTNIIVQSLLNTHSQVNVYLNSSGIFVMNWLSSSDNRLNFTPVNVINPHINDDENRMHVVPS